MPAAHDAQAKRLHEMLPAEHDAQAKMLHERESAQPQQQAKDDEEARRVHAAEQQRIEALHADAVKAAQDKRPLEYIGGWPSDEKASLDWEGV
ncbi:hypothetical protein T484DRAFT_1760980 [Baffinella frigidus]|nr:hypothetical protein T484DRAFT_1760980 [Cryptophyta sp. CCMP2293]